jgi:hypothetical protein
MQQPGPERPSASEAREAAVRTYEGILRDVLCRRRVAQHKVGRPESHLLVARDEQAEGLAVTFADGSQHGIVVGLVRSHSLEIPRNEDGGSGQQRREHRAQGDRRASTRPVGYKPECREAGEAVPKGGCSQCFHEGSGAMPSAILLA